MDAQARARALHTHPVRLRPVARHVRGRVAAVGAAVQLHVNGESSPLALALEHKVERGVLRRLWRTALKAKVLKGLCGGEPARLKRQR